MSNRLPPDRRLRRALSRAAYRERRIRIASDDWRGFDCLVASRAGLFGVSRARVVPLLWGMFFGSAAHEGQVYLFEACDRPSGRSMMGRILRLRLAEGRVVDAGILVEGLDNQCHQIAMIGDLLHVVDTAAQCIRRFDADGRPKEPLYPLAGLAAPLDYRHINSVAAIGDRIMLVLHNGAGPGIARPSERAVLDAGGRIAALHAIAGFGCHDIWCDAGGAVWHCGSMAGELVRADGYRVRVSERMTRGVARCGGQLLVGTSLFGERGTREALGGSLLYLDDDLNCLAEVELPGAPTTVLALPA